MKSSLLELDKKRRKKKKEKGKQRHTRAQRGAQLVPSCRRIIRGVLMNFSVRRERSSKCSGSFKDASGRTVPPLILEIPFRRLDTTESHRGIIDATRNATSRDPLSLSRFQARLLEFFLDLGKLVWEILDKSEIFSSDSGWKLLNLAGISSPRAPRRERWKVFRYFVANELSWLFHCVN